MTKTETDIQIAFFDIDGTLVDMDWRKMTETMRKVFIIPVSLPEGAGSCAMGRIRI